MTITRVLRGIAVLIAVLGIVDPSIMATRRQKPVVALVTSDLAGAELTGRVVSELERTFTIVRGPFTGASAVVAVGNRLPESADLFPGPAFAVTSAGDLSAVSLEAVDAPSRAQFQARVRVMATVRAMNAAGRTLDLTLEHAGVALDRAARKIASGDERVRVPLTFVPVAQGAVHLRVVARIEGVAATTVADLVVDVREDRWAVLVFDGRPSWTSTFVRRALESDPRFAVTTRIVTSRNVTTDTGRPPREFDVSSLEAYDAVVVGAPETVTERDISGLEAYLRRRGGAVILLLDQRARGPYDRLLSVSEWGSSASAGPAPVDSAGSSTAGQLQATELAWPLRLPPGATPIAESGVSSPAKSAAVISNSVARRPVVWRTPAGAGQIVVNGALDAWRFRNASAAAFDRFWRTVVAAAAAASVPPIDARLDSAVLAPGESTTVRVTLRDAALAETVEGQQIAANVAATLESPAGDRVPIRLWPEAGIGRFAGAVVAPATAGAYRVAVSSAGARADAQVVVVPGAAHASPSERDLLEAWARSRRGHVVPIARVNEVAAALDRLLQPDQHRARWHPMRSPWWIVPFAAALGTEWWWRRRRGWK